MRIELPLIPTDLELFLHLDEDPIYTEPPVVSVPLRAAGVQDSTITRFYHQISPERMTLRSFKD